MAHPDGSLIGCGPLTMLLAGGPRERLAEAERVVAAAGFVPKYVGSIRCQAPAQAFPGLGRNPLPLAPPPAREAGPSPRLGRSAASSCWLGGLPKTCPALRPALPSPLSRYARNLEAIAELWVHLSLGPVGDSSVDWGRNFHFQVVDDRQAKQAQQEREG